MYTFSRLALELKTPTKSADTAVVMREYGPLTRPPHTNSMPGKHRLGELYLGFYSHSQLKKYMIFLINFIPLLFEANPAGSATSSRHVSLDDNVYHDNYTTPEVLLLLSHCTPSSAASHCVT